MAWDGIQEYEGVRGNVDEGVRIHRSLVYWAKGRITKEHKAIRRNAEERRTNTNEYKRIRMRI